MFNINNYKTKMSFNSINNILVNLEKISIKNKLKKLNEKTKIFNFQKNNKKNIKFHKSGIAKSKS